MNVFERNSLFGSDQNVEIHENSWKPSKILDEYPTKIYEKSCFEHVKVTLRRKAWFSCPERFWPRSGNTLPQAPKFCGFWFENCSDPPKSTKMNVVWRNSLPGSGQNRMQKRWNSWKFVKIVENHRWVQRKGSESCARSFEFAKIKSKLTGSTSLGYNLADFSKDNTVLAAITLY